MDRATLKRWFSRGKKPTAAQFAEVFNSFFHKTEDNIGIADIGSLQQALNEKAEVQHRHTAAEIDGLPTIDNELSENSQNAVANATVTRALAGKSSVRHTHGMADVNGLQAVVEALPQNLADRLSAIEAHVWHVENAVQADVETGCSVTLSHNQATVGTIVTATVVVGTGYNFDGLDVIVLDNKGFATLLTLPVTDNGNGTYGFVMPFGDVEVWANFSQTRYAITIDCDTSMGSINAPASALGGDTVDFEIWPHEGYDFIQESISILNEATGEEVEGMGGENYYSFVMPAAPVTISVTFVSTTPAEPGWRIVENAPSDWSGEYILASIDDAKMATGNLSSYQIACSAVVLAQGKVIAAADAANAKKFTIGNRYFVQTGAYSGRYAYTITYQNANNETKYLTYSASGLSNGTSINNNTRWYIDFDPNTGKVSLINIGSTTTRLYFYTDHIQQLTASNHDSISSDYHKLSLFSPEGMAEAAE